MQHISLKFLFGVEFIIFIAVRDIGTLGRRVSRFGPRHHFNRLLWESREQLSSPQLSPRMRRQAKTKLPALASLLWASSPISRFRLRQHVPVSHPSPVAESIGKRAPAIGMNGVSSSSEKDQLHLNLSGMTHDTFECQGFKCSYRRKPASPGSEGKPPLLLIHPIGVGLSAWFWDRFLGTWDGAEVFVPDLIGCGESEVWEPSKKGLFVPLDYVRQLEILWREKIKRPAVVISQGGLAPLAVQLAIRANDDFQGSQAVRGLVLASPPSWSDMVNGYDDKQVAANFKRLSTRLGTLGYRVFLSRFFIRQFSEKILFAGKADDLWLDEACARATVDVRWPIIAFNAGMFGREALSTELKEGIGADSQLRFASGIRQPTLVISGSKDRRAAKRVAYRDGIVNCRLEEVPGLNIVPWESPVETCQCVRAFVDDIFIGAQ